MLCAVLCEGQRDERGDDEHRGDGAGGPLQPAAHGNVIVAYMHDGDESAGALPRTVHNGSPGTRRRPHRGGGASADAAVFKFVRVVPAS